ncbi:MAG: protein jag [Oscillospiraceae bacterium]|jgi:spoIIIJ-associated protein|nr:protein jag [Oscillospiraceae bacterium]
MIKVLQKSAKTEEEAVRLALEELGLSRDDVSVEIIERAKSGVFGIGGKLAVVAVSYEAPDEKPAKPEPSARPAKADKPEKAEKAEKPAARSSKPSVGTGEVHDFLDGLLTRFGVPAEIVVSDEVDGTVNVVLNASEAGALIGRRGETLDAIQHLANYAVNRGDGKHLRVNIDTENYRERRGETLEALAAKTAAKVVKYRRNLTLDPMNAYERHVIHTALQDHELVSTHSVGSEPNRRVVVTYGKNSDSSREFSRGNSGRGPWPNRDSRPPREEAPQPEPVTRDEASNAPVPAENPSVREWS